MNTRMQSASTKTAAKPRAAKPRTTDVGELFLFELAARRARLQELLRMVRLEVAREMESSSGSRRPVCRRISNMRVRSQGSHTLPRVHAN
jgi:hypothetical protein